MSSQLRNLIVFTGLIVSSFGVYIVAKDGDPNAVKTQALADGFVARAAEAEFELTPEGIAWFADAGIAAPKYARLQFPVAIGNGKEADGGDVVIIPELPLKYIQRVQDSSATITPCASRPGVCPKYGDNRPFVIVPHQCAWKPIGATQCFSSDGGDPGFENTMQPGKFSGAQCILKSCVEIAGESSAP